MSKEFRHIVRITETDLDGTMKINQALSNIKGIGIGLADIIIKKAEVSPDARIGFLSETEIEKLEDIIKTPGKYGLPGWLLNRPKDAETGKDIHLVGSDLTLQIKNDIEGMKKIRSWRGYRHAYGLKVRGQRTKVTGRTGKAVGVKKKTLMERAKAKEKAAA
jgi:small subunit ribosomal protein S13